MPELSIKRNTSHGDWITRFAPATQDAKFGKLLFCARLIGRLLARVHVRKVPPQESE